MRINQIIQAIIFLFILCISCSNQLKNRFSNIEKIYYAHRKEINELTSSFLELEIEWIHINESEISFYLPKTDEPTYIFKRKSGGLIQTQEFFLGSTEELKLKKMAEHILTLGVYEVYTRRESVFITLLVGFDMTAGICFMNFPTSNVKKKNSINLLPECYFQEFEHPWYFFNTR